MEEVKCYPILFSKYSNTLFYDGPSVLQVVIIEIESDKNVPFVQFLNNSYGMTPESEGAVDHYIPLCRAQIETVDILMEEHGNMSKTFFVQIVKK